MVRLAAVLWILVCGFCSVCYAEGYDRIASIGESPNGAETDSSGNHGMLVDLVRALDKATHTSTKIIVQPFARSFKETAAGRADFHFPLIQNGNFPPPNGLVYVMDVDFGQAQFVIYSRKTFPLDVKTIPSAKSVETEAGHETFFPFLVGVTHCVRCSLDKVALGRTDALIASADEVDPLLSNPKYKGIHRALYKTYPIRALVPANVDSAPTRQYLRVGVSHLKKTGELWKYMLHNKAYSDWQP